MLKLMYSFFMILFVSCILCVNYSYADLYAEYEDCIKKGQKLVLSRDYKEAISHFQQCINTYESKGIPDYLGSYEIGRVYEKLDDKNNACYWFQIGIKKHGVGSPSDMAYKRLCQ